MEASTERDKEIKAILVKMAKYCAYQDRCKKEVYIKLDTLLPDIVEQDKIIDYLIDEKYLDEERYVRSIVRGRFYYKSWGKIKIIHYLKQRDIDSDTIEKVIANEIKDSDYYQKVNELVENRLRTTKGINDFEIKQKILKALFLKGYDSGMITDVIDELQQSH